MPPWTDKLIRTIRLSKKAEALGQFYDQRLIPVVFAAITMVIGAYLFWSAVKLAVAFGWLVWKTLVKTIGLG